MDETIPHRLLIKTIFNSFQYGGIDDHILITMLQSVKLPKQLLDFFVYIVKKLPEAKPNLIKIFKDIGADDSMTTEGAKAIMVLYEIERSWSLFQTLHKLTPKLKTTSVPSKPKTFLETQGIYTKSDFHVWLIKHHPDRGGNEQEFINILKIGKSTFK